MDKEKKNSDYFLKRSERFIRDNVLVEESDDIYENFISSQIVQNIKENYYVDRKELLSKRAKKRIEEYAVNKHFKVEKVLENVLGNEFFYYEVVVPNVSRQSSHFESILKNYFEKNLKCFVTNLPNGGINSMLLQNGEKIHKNNVDKTLPYSSKTIDLEINKENNKNMNNDFYIVHKRTMEAGGAQDNQFNDAKSFLYAHPKTSKNILILCLDGKYYKKVKKETNKTILEELRDEYKNRDNIIIGDYLMVSKELEKYFKKIDEK